MADVDQEQDQNEIPDYQLTGDDLSELHGVATQLQSANDPRAAKLWD